MAESNDGNSNGNGVVIKLLTSAILVVLGGLGGNSIGHRGPSDVQEARMEVLEQRSMDATTKLAAIEATITEVKSGVTRLERAIDRVADRKP